VDSETTIGGNNKGYQTSNGDKPDYDEDGINGVPALIFDGTEDMDMDNHAAINTT